MSEDDRRPTPNPIVPGPGEIASLSDHSSPKGYILDHGLPYTHPRNIVPTFHTLIEHVQLAAYIPRRDLLSLQGTSIAFFHLISSFLYERLSIDLKDPRNPCATWPFHHFPHPVPVPSVWKSRAFSHVKRLELVGSHGYECSVFDHIRPPRLHHLRITLPAGRFKAWCARDPSLATDPSGKPVCCFLRNARCDKLVVEVDRLEMIDVFARRDWFQHDELVVRIGRVGEDAVLGERGRWPRHEGLDQAAVYQADPAAENLRKLTKGHRKALGVSRQDARSGAISEQTDRSTRTASPTPDDAEAGSLPSWARRLDILPSLSARNTVPNLTIVCLSLPNKTLPPPLLFEDERTPEIRFQHHLYALASVISPPQRVDNGTGSEEPREWQRVTLVNAGVLLFWKHGIRRERDSLKEMQNEVRTLLLDVLERRSGTEGVELGRRVRFLGLPEYLDEEGERADMRKKATKSEGDTRWMTL
ncbi:hypothetical protein IAU60_001578 [Kwoniella sp. DSM 27419]